MTKQIETEKPNAGNGGEENTDPRCVPIKLEAALPVGDEIAYPYYTYEEHQSWQIMFERQMELLVGRACEEYLKGLEVLQFPHGRIPPLNILSRLLNEVTGWKVARSPGLLDEKDFFTCLANRIFPCTDYIRCREEIDYTPAPDMFHDIFGHTPMITDPAFAEFYQKIGQAALNAEGEDRIRLQRIYWFTVEFGLIQSSEGLRIYGNGIVSSYNEVQHSLTDAVEKRPFDAAKIAEQDFDIWHLQPLLYVIESFEQLQEGFYDWAASRGLMPETDK